MTAALDLLATLIIGSGAYYGCLRLSAPPREVTEVDDGPLARLRRGLTGEHSPAEGSGDINPHGDGSVWASGAES